MLWFFLRNFYYITKIKKCMKIINFVTLNLLILFSFSVLSREIISFKISSCENIHSYLSKLDSTVRVSDILNAIINVKLDNIISNYPQAVDLNKPIYGSLIILPDRPFALKSVTFLPCRDEKLFIESFSANFFLKKIGDYYAITTEGAVLDNVESGFPAMQASLSENIQGVFIRWHFSEFWNIMKPLSLILRGVATVALAINETFQKQFNQLLELLFFSFDSIENVMLDFGINDANEQRIISYFKLKPDSLYNALFPKVDFKYDYQGFGDYDTTLRVVFSPLKIREILVRFIEMLNQKFLLNSVELSVLNERIQSIFGDIKDDSLYYLENIQIDDIKYGVRTIIRIQSENGSFNINGFKNITGNLFEIIHGKCIWEETKEGHLKLKLAMNSNLSSSLVKYDKSIAETERDKSLGEDSTLQDNNLLTVQGGNDIPSFINRLLFFLSGINPELSFEFLIQDKQIIGINSDGNNLDSNLFDFNGAKNNASNEPFFEFKLTPSYFMKILFCFINLNAKKETDTANKCESISRIIFKLYKLDEGIKIETSFSSEELNKEYKNLKP